MRYRNIRKICVACVACVALDTINWLSSQRLDDVELKCLTSSWNVWRRAETFDEVAPKRLTKSSRNVWRRAEKLWDKWVERQVCVSSPFFSRSYQTHYPTLPHFHELCSYKSHRNFVAIKVTSKPKHFFSSFSFLFLLSLPFTFTFTFTFTLFFNAWSLHLLLNINSIN